MTEAISLTGSGFLILLALGFFRMAFGHWFCRYGLETIILAGVVFLCQALLRLADSAELLTPTTTRCLGGVLYIIAVAILAQIVYAHWIWHRLAGSHAGTAG